MGAGLGAFIATQAAVLDDRISGLILENGFVNYESYLDYYATLKWGRLELSFQDPLPAQSRKTDPDGSRRPDLSGLLALVKVPTLSLPGARRLCSGLRISHIERFFRRSAKRIIFDTEFLSQRYG
jgi:hypothetical protein